MKSTNFVLGVFGLIICAVIIMIGKNTNLQFYSGTSPGPAFLPFISAAGIGVCGLILIVGSLLKSAHASDTEQAAENNGKAIWIFKYEELWNFTVAIGVSALILYFTDQLGLLLSLAIGMAVIAKLLGTPGWRTPIVVGIISWIVLYSIFDWLLQTPLPRGMFGI